MRFVVDALTFRCYYHFVSNEKREENIMTKYQIVNTVSGTDLGIYEAKSEDEALDEMAIAAGYRDYEQACELSDAWCVEVREVSE
jgi:hypothetical protein